MTDPTRPAPVSGYPAQPTNGYPQHPPPQQPNYYYPNPNPNQQYYPPPPPPPPPPRTIFYRRVMSALILTFIILAVILFIVYLILRPRVPIFTLTSLSLSSVNISTSSLSATWTATIQVTNPNTKLHVYYDEIEARVFYQRYLLALNQLPPFDQPVRDQTVITGRLTAASAYIEPDLSRKFSDDRSKGNIEFDVEVLALVKFKAGGWRARRRGLRALCDGLGVNVNGSSGGLSGGSRRCAVGI